MSRIVLPYRPVSGGPEIVEQLVANEDAISSVVNGDLAAEVNVQVGPPTAALTGAANSEGSASTLLRSDAQFILRGVEQLSTEPTGDHFRGRVYYDTTDDQLKICTNASTGVYTPFTNLAPTEVPTHGSSHGQSGTDPLPDLGVGSDMLGRSVQTKIMSGGPITNISHTGFTTIMTTDQITLAGSQVVTLSGRMIVNNASGLGDTARVYWRIVDTENSDAFVVGSMGNEFFTGMTGSAVISGIAQLATGTHTLRLQAGYTSATVSAGVDITDTITVNTQAFTTHVNILVG